MVEKIIGSADIINRAGVTVSPATALAGKKAVGLYFSAHWCPPCKAFTPILGEACNDAASDEFAMIFVSFDQSMPQFFEYFGSMPENWLAFSLSDKRREQLGQIFNVSGIPRLIILNAKTGAIINNDARAEVTQKGPEAILGYVAKAQ
ncbi:hypothetical protein FGO68_gene7670 [Halteria grandinella]|uniref:protein-disulfide reductase n=1 Tax=Halteria grandinella TaxID=5974 RepID=A0A8J8SYV0_HALGN|nr:hypothetical protein FGO68_gene7670 [Halteria grandinella]